MDITQTGVATHIGSLMAGSSRTIVFKITAPAGPIGDSLKFEVAAGSTWPGIETPVVSSAVTTKLTYAGSDDSRAQPREEEISLLVARTWQATTVRRIVELNRRRQTDEAEHYLDSQLVQFRDYCLTSQARRTHRGPGNDAPSNLSRLEQRGRKKE